MSALSLTVAAIASLAFPTDGDHTVDARTGVGLPGLEVSFTSWSGGEPTPAGQATTDADGAFDRPVDWVGPVSVSVFDPATQTALSRFPEEGSWPEPPETLRLELELGPTLFFRLGDGDEELRDWRLRLVERAPDGRRRVWPWRAGQPGDPSWIRYARDEYAPDAEFAWWLEAQARGRTRSGAGRVEAPAAVTRLELEELATITGHLRFAGSEEPAPDLVVRAVPRDDPDAWATPSRWPAGRSAADGRFALVGLERGRYHLWAELGGIPAARADVSADGPIEVSLAVRGGSHSLRGRVLGDDAPCWLSVVDEANEVVRTIPWSARESTSFRFDGLAAGEHRLAVSGVGAFGAWVVEVPREERLELRKGSDARLGSVEVRSADGTLLSDARLQVWTESAWFPEAAPASAFAWIEAPLEWAALAPGHRPRFGRSRGAPDPVTLEPGWGVRLRVRNLDGDEFPAPDDWGRYRESREAPPVVGARVLADGVEVGRTDGAGFCTLALEAPPERLTLDHPTMTLVANPLFRDGRIRGSSAEVILWMRTSAP